MTVVSADHATNRFKLVRLPSVSNATGQSYHSIALVSKFESIIDCSSGFKLAEF